MIYKSLIFICLVLFISCSTGNNSGEIATSEQEVSKEIITTLILVRHAEKVKDGSENPALNEKGIKRSIHMSKMLGHSGITAIYSTPFHRNIGTVKPLSESTEIPITKYDEDLDLTNFLENVLSENMGGKVLICGHSTTIPSMLNILGNKNKYTEFEKDNYNNLYMVSMVGKEKGIITNLMVEL